MMDALSKNRIFGIASVILTVMGCLYLLGVSFCILYQFPIFAAMYADMEIELPRITRLVLSLPSGAVLVVTLLLISLLVAKEFISRKIIPLVLNIIWLLASVALTFLITWAITLPMERAFTA